MQDAEQEGGERNRQRLEARHKGDGDRSDAEAGGEIIHQAMM